MTSHGRGQKDRHYCEPEQDRLTHELEPADSARLEGVNRERDKRHQQERDSHAHAEIPAPFLRVVMNPRNSQNNLDNQEDAVQKPENSFI